MVTRLTMTVGNKQRFVMRGFAQYVHDTFDSHNATPDRFINVIKAVREATGWGLKDSKLFVDQYRYRPDGPCCERIDVDTIKNVLIENRQAPREVFQSRETLIKRLQNAKSHFRNQEAQIRLLQEKLDRAMGINLQLRLENALLLDRIHEYEDEAIAQMKPYAQA